VTTATLTGSGRFNKNNGRSNMPTLSGNLTQLLPGKYQTAGYALSEEEDFIHVYFKGKHLETFSSHRTNLSAITEFIENRIIADAQ